MILESEALTAHISRGQTTGGASFGPGTVPMGTGRPYGGSLGSGRGLNELEGGESWSSGDAAEGGLYRYTDRGTDYTTGYSASAASSVEARQGYRSRSIDLNQSVTDGSVPPKLLQKFKRIIQEKEAFRQVRRRYTRMLFNKRSISSN